MKTRSYITFAALLLSAAVTGQTEQEAIKRSVTLYNPYKPTLQEATKRSLIPAVTDTATVKVEFRYDFTPGSFVPEYKISPIKSAVLSPDPMPELKKGYVSLGFGTYLTPYAELSVGSIRSRKGTAGLYARTYSSGSRIELENDDRVYGGFMDNQALLFGKKYFRRSRLDADIDFRQMTRYAYGYDPDVTGYSPDKNDIKSLYYDVTGKVRYFTMEQDSNDLNWDAAVRYNLFARAGNGVQHNPGITFKGGKNLYGLYTGANIDYDLWLFSKDIDTRTRNLLALSPYLTKGNEEWRFRFGIKAAADIRENYEPLSGGDLKAYLYFYPDVSFTFRIIPKFMRFTASLDGSLDNNQARNTAFVNPLLLPGDTLFTLRSTSNQLRGSAGLSGSFNVGASYALDVSYTIFKDLLLFMNDTLGVGNWFLPVYDDGNLLKVHGEITYPLNQQISLTVQANYYGYNMSGQQYAWHKPDWDGLIKADYNLRNKIVATASLSLTGTRHAVIKAPDRAVRLPWHPSLNVGMEYRYTPVLSFWLKCNNISYNRYFEWNFYPARNFMIMGGFTYSL